MSEVNIARRFAPGATTSEIIELPQVLSGSGVLMRPGEMLKPVHKVLPLAVSMIRRMTPWASVTMAPRLYLRGFCAALSTEKTSHDPLNLIEHKEEIWEAALGVAVPSFNSIFLSTACGPFTLLQTVTHECWHMIEAKLAPWMIELIDDQIEATVASSYWDPQYYHLPHEVRARAFEAWCNRLLAGLPAPSFVREIDAAETIDEIFWSAWSGQLAQELQSERQEAA